jgi:hypothetical protein
LSPPFPFEKNSGLSLKAEPKDLESTETSPKKLEFELKAQDFQGPETWPIWPRHRALGAQGSSDMADSATS